LVLEGRICKWFLLFQEFSFKVIVKPGRCNVGLDHLSRLESGESGGEFDDQLPDEEFFRIKYITKYLEDIVSFLSSGAFPKNYFSTLKRHLVV
jgi:hypothetical protein